MLALLISKLHLSYVFKVYIKTLQSLEFILKCSHKYDLVWKKKRECQSFDVCPRQHSHNSYLMTVLVRGVLSAKLVLRYKHIFEAIL